MDGHGQSLQIAANENKGSTKLKLQLKLKLSLAIKPTMFQIVISKLRQQTALDHDRRHLKAAKVLLCNIVPHHTVYSRPWCL